MSKQINTMLAIGGLMRCCTETVDDYVVEHADEEAIEGMTLQCKYSENRSHRMILKNNIWQWDRPAQPWDA